MFVRNTSQFLILLAEDYLCNNIGSGIEFNRISEFSVPGTGKTSPKERNSFLFVK